MKQTLAMLSLAGLALAGCAANCLDPGTPQATLRDLLPGEYRIVLAATDGSKIGSQVRGRVWLVRAQDHWSDSKMYGRILLDFDAVGAPVYAEDGADPASMDPKRPGVLVETADWDGYPAGTPVLTIGTENEDMRPVANADGTDTITISADGFGIGLWVHRASAKSFSGRWSEWGIAVDGRGTFCATRIH